MEAGVGVEFRIHRPFGYTTKCLFYLWHLVDFPSNCFVKLCGGLQIFEHIHLAWAPPLSELPICWLVHCFCNSEVHHTLTRFLLLPFSGTPSLRRMIYSPLASLPNPLKRLGYGLKHFFLCVLLLLLTVFAGNSLDAVSIGDVVYQSKVADRRNG